MQRRTLFLTIAALLLISMLFSQGNVMTDQCVNGACVIHAKTSPVAVLVGIAMLVLIVSFKRKLLEPLDGRVKLRTRIGAFLIDLFTASAIVGPLTALPMLGYAALVSGPFMWAIESIAPSPFDHIVAVALVISGFIGLFAYFLAPVARGIQTPGQYIFGYRVETNGLRRPNWFILGFSAFVGVATWPISLLLASRRDDREFWWSAKSGLRAVTLARKV
jgi:uncharacterized RDD family membrane protein YckC